MFQAIYTLQRYVNQWQNKNITCLPGQNTGVKNEQPQELQEFCYIAGESP